MKQKIREIENNKDATAVEKNLMVTLEVCYEFYLRGFHFDTISIYDSDATAFRITENGLLPPFISVRGLGESAALDTVEKRKGKRFISVEEFSTCCNKLSKTHIEQLKALGPSQAWRIPARSPCSDMVRYIQITQVPPQRMALWRSWLSPQRRKRAERMPDDRETVCGEGLARELLAAALHCLPEEAPLRYDAQGKPLDGRPVPASATAVGWRPAPWRTARWGWMWSWCGLRPRRVWEHLSPEE